MVNRWDPHPSTPARRGTVGVRPSRRRGRRRWSWLPPLPLLLVGLAVAAGLPASPAQAAPGDLVVTQTDRSGDVMLLGASGPGTPGAVARRSIDLRAFSLVEQRNGVRMTVTLGRILTHSKYDQVVEVQMSPPAGSGGLWFLDVAMSGQEPLDSVATYSLDLSGDHTEICGDLTANVDPATATLSLFVPALCLPTDPAKIKVFSSLGHYPSGGVGYSLDRMKIRGDYSMHS